MQLGLGARLALIFGGLAALTALITAGVSAYTTSSEINAGVDSFLRVRSAEVAEGSRSVLREPPERGRGSGGRGDGRNNNNNDDELDDSIEAVADLDAQVQVLAPDGSVLGGAGRGLPVEQQDLALLDRRGFMIRTIQIDDQSYRMITRHIEGGGVVQVARSLATTEALLSNVRTETVTVGAIMSALAAAVGWGIAQRTTRPLRKLTSSVEEVAATEDLATPVTLDRSDEIGRLSEEFDRLLKTLGASRDQQQRLVQDAAHELRTPLTSVRANIDFLERAADLDPADRQSTLASIKAELAELSSILAEVVELATESRGEAGFDAVDLAAVADSALAQFALRSDRPVVRELEPTVVFGDSAALERAAKNLIENADKYSPAGLAITVRVSDGSLAVADQGPGIALEDRERIFDRFYRSDRDRSAPGSGLGLAIVAKAANEHGGSVWAREATGGGAEVGFTVPELGSPQTHPSHVGRSL